MDAGADRTWPRSYRSTRRTRTAGSACGRRQGRYVDMGSPTVQIYLVRRLRKLHWSTSKVVRHTRW